jgi:hypothetical protein
VTGRGWATIFFSLVALALAIYDLATGRVVGGVFFVVLAAGGIITRVLVRFSSFDSLRSDEMPLPQRTGRAVLFITLAVGSLGCAAFCKIAEDAVPGTIVFAAGAGLFLAGARWEPPPRPVTTLPAVQMWSGAVVGMVLGLLLVIDGATALLTADWRVAMIFVFLLGPAALAVGAVGFIDLYLLGRSRGDRSARG